jgi:hypothetical protein
MAAVIFEVEINFHFAISRQLLLQKELFHML